MNRKYTNFFKKPTRTISTSTPSVTYQGHLVYITIENSRDLVLSLRQDDVDALGRAGVSTTKFLDASVDAVVRPVLSNITEAVSMPAHKTIPPLVQGREYLVDGDNMHVHVFSTRIEDTDLGIFDVLDKNYSYQGKSVVDLYTVRPKNG